MNSILNKPSAWLPIAMSLAALALVLGYLALFGIAEQPPQTDEGAAAHLFQLLMGGQVPIVLFFIIKWLPRMPKQALLVLALQFAAGLAALAPVFFLEL